MDKHYALKQSPEYKLWRSTIYRRDRWKCKVCGKNGRIEAHHIFPLRSHYEKRVDVNNGITLCFGCHRLIFGKELLVARWLLGLININGVNSVDIQKDNTEPSRDGNFSEGVTTRSRGYRLEQFINKEVQCSECDAKLIRHYYRIKRSKRFWCSKACNSSWVKKNQSGENNPNYKKPKIYKCLYCGKKTQTPTYKHREKKYCTNTCQLRYEYKNGLKKKLKPYLNGKWTKKFLSCVICGEKDKPHYGRGRCMPCYNEEYNSKKRQ